MTPDELIATALRISRRVVHEGNRRTLSIPPEDWFALRDYLAQLEPITQWPAPERPPPTKLVVHGVEVVVSRAAHSA